MDKISFFSLISICNLIHITKEDIHMTNNNVKKMLNITSHQKCTFNSQQDITTHPLEWLTLKRLKIPRTCKDVEQPELLLLWECKIV